MDEDSPVFPIAVAAELAGMHPQTLRQYDRLGLVSPGRTAGKSRRYSMRDVAQLREIARLSARRAQPGGRPPHPRARERDGRAAGEGARPRGDARRCHAAAARRQDLRGGVGGRGHPAPCRPASAEAEPGGRVAAAETRKHPMRKQAAASLAVATLVLVGCAAPTPTPSVTRDQSQTPTPTQASPTRPTPGPRPQLRAALRRVRPASGLRGDPVDAPRRSSRRRSVSGTRRGCRPVARSASSVETVAPTPVTTKA